MSASTLDRPLSILPGVVRKDAMPKCARTAITTVTTCARRYRTGPHLVMRPESALRESSLPDLATTRRPYAAD